MCSTLQANYTFYFVDKIKTLSETLLKMSSLFQGSGHGQMFNQLQVCSDQRLGFTCCNLAEILGCPCKKILLV